MVEAKLEEVLKLQRQAYLKQLVPSLAQRRADLMELRRFVLMHQDALCEAIKLDYGHRSRHETLMADIMPTLMGIDHALKHLARWMKPQQRSVDWRLFFGARNRLASQPLGVVGVIVPWNFPVFLSFGPLTYAFAAGNRAMVKMSEHSRHLSAFLMAHMPAHFAPEKLQFFEETGGVGVAFSALRFDHIFFTGSSQTGRSVMRAAAQNLCPVTLELGGKTPAIVCADFSLRVAAERILFAKLLNAGQACVAVDHVWLPRQQLEAFVDCAGQIVRQRYNSLHSADYTSIISQHAFDRLLLAIDEARAGGAQVICLLDGPAFDPASRKIAPHVVLNAPENCALMRDEIFGPILPIKTYDALVEVVHSIQSGPAPLAMYPFSQDGQVIQYLLDHVKTGGVSVNNVLLHFVQFDLPVGGVGESGMGQTQGRAGFDAFSQMRPVFYQAPWNTSCLFWPPYGKLIERLLRFFSK